VNDREDSGAGHGEDGHGLGKAADGVAPSLLEEQQNGRDQRAGVADADPPDEIDNRKAPGHGLRDGPDADALEEQPGQRHHEHSCAAASKSEESKPAHGRVRREHDAHDLLGDGPEGLARRDHAVFAGCGIDPLVSGFYFFGRHGPFLFPCSLGPCFYPLAGVCSTGVSSSSWFRFKTSAT
jgi:hypothetical protein